jgi:Tol biopolymer transport system component
MNGSRHRGRASRFALVLAAAVLAVAAVALPATAAPARQGAHTGTGAATLAFVRAEHVWSIGAGVGTATQLTKGTSEDSIPVWSPDGLTVAFVRSGASGMNATVRTVPAAGGAPQLLYKSAIPKAIYLAITGLAYTPDGKQITFAESWATDSPGDIGRCRVVSYELASGKTKVLLSRNGGFGNVIGADWQIAWSPDGTTLAIAQSGQDSEGGQTWLFTPSSGGLRRLGTGQASFADWAPSGDALLLSTFTQPRSKVQLVSTAGKVLRTLASGGGWTGAPSVNDARFSWDGVTVAYTFTPRSGTPQVWLMSATGTGKHKLTTGSQPAWR